MRASFQTLNRSPGIEQVMAGISDASNAMFALMLYNAHLHRAKASHLLHNLIFCNGSTGFSLAVKMKIKAFLCLGGQQLTSSVLQMPFIGVRAIHFPHTPSVDQDPAAQPQGRWTELQYLCQ